MKYYDVNTKGFYEESAENRIAITDDYWNELLDKQSEGGVLQAVGEQVFCILANEVVQNGEILDISRTDEYKSKVLAEENNKKILDLQAQIDELDKKSIRALREGGIKDEVTGQTWLEYYIEKIVTLRAEISNF